MIIVTYCNQYDISFLLSENDLGFTNNIIKLEILIRVDLIINRMLIMMILLIDWLIDWLIIHMIKHLITTLTIFTYNYAYVKSFWHLTGLVVGITNQHRPLLRRRQILRHHRPNRRRARRNRSWRTDELSSQTVNGRGGGVFLVLGNTWVWAIGVRRGISPHCFWRCSLCALVRWPRR